MASQGLFTQGITVDDLLKQRRVRSQQQQQLMANQAAQGARDPQRARMGSMFGSIIGKALGENAGGADSEMEKLEASNAQKQQFQGSYGELMSSGTPEQLKQGAQAFYKAGYITEAGDLNNAANVGFKAQKEQRQNALDLSLEQEDASEANAKLQENAVVVSKGLEKYAPAVYTSLVNGEATAQALTNGYKAQQEMRKIKYDEANGTTTDSKLSFTEAGSFADKAGNMYVATKSVGKTGTAKIIYTGIGDAPEYKKGIKLQPLNSNNMTIEQQVELTGEQSAARQQAKDWSDTMTTARENRISLQDSEYFINKAIRLLPKIGKTGSVATKLTKEVTDFWGVTSADIGEFDQLSAKTALGQLKTTFGASPTEGERAILFSIQANIDNNRGLNTRILKSAKEMVEWRIRANKAALSDGTPSGRKYNTWLLDDANGPPSYTPETEESEETVPKVIRKFGQLTPTKTSWGGVTQ